MVADDADAVIANGDNVRWVNYGVLALFSCIRLETMW